MKEVTLRIPEKKLGFFMELVRQLGFEVAESVDITDDHKSIVRDRINTAKSEEMIPWDEARKNITFKDKS